VDGFPEIPKTFGSSNSEFGTEEDFPQWWQFWHTTTNYGQRATISTVHRSQSPMFVKRGDFSLKTEVDVRAFSIEGRNDLIYPTFRNAHWDFSTADSITFSVKFPSAYGSFSNAYGTNPIIRLCQNGNNRIEFVPRRGGLYANFFDDTSFIGSDGWYNFRVPVSGNDLWERNLIGYIDPALNAEEKDRATQNLIADILRDVNYFEISIKLDGYEGELVTYYVDDLKIHYKTAQPNAPDLTGEEAVMSVFPVPAENELNLKIKGKEEENALVIIKNVQGYTVYSSLSSIKELNRNTISTSGLQPGVYFLHLRGQNKNHFNVIKFIKK